MGILLFSQACTSVPSLSKIELTYTGSYTVTKDNEDPLNCFCRNGGYIDTCDRQRIALCFEGTAPPDDCLDIEIWGYMINEAIAEYGSPPCQVAEVRYLLVERWVCKDK